MSERKNNEKKMPSSFMYAFPILTAVAAVGIGLYFLITRTQPENRHRAYHNSNSKDFVDSSNRCTICLEDIREIEAKYLNCGHSFHTRCINKWLNSNNVCPNCKTHAL